MDRPSDWRVDAMLPEATDGDLRHQLQERAKELYCLDEVAQLLSQEQPLEQTLVALTQVIPDGFQRPDRCRCEVVLQGEVIGRAPVECEGDALEVPLVAGRETVGTIKVTHCYPEDDVSPNASFLVEEVGLLGSIASLVGQYIHRTRTQEALRQSEERFRLAQEVTRVGIWDWDLRSGHLWPLTLHKAATFATPAPVCRRCWAGSRVKWRRTAMRS